MPPVAAIAAVAMGGSIGAAMRHAWNLVRPWSPDTFPWATLTENLTGALLLGVLVASLRSGRRIPRHLGAFLGTGVLGSFTTFSALSMETRLLIPDAPAFALAYVLASLIVGLLAAMVGLRLGRMLFGQPPARPREPGAQPGALPGASE